MTQLPDSERRQRLEKVIDDNRLSPSVRRNAIHELRLMDREHELRQPQRMTPVISLTAPSRAEESTDAPGGIDEEALLAAKRAQHKRRVKNLKEMLKRERKQRGEDPEPRPKGQRILDWNLFIQASPDASGAPADVRAVNAVATKGLSLLPSLRTRLTEQVDDTPEVRTAKRIVSLLNRRNRIAVAEENLKTYRGSGKPIGTAMLGDQIVIGDGEVKVFNGRATKDQLKEGSSDRNIMFEDIRSGQVTVSVAPSALDKVKSALKIMGGDPDNMPGTLLLEDKSGRRHVIRNVMGAQRLAERLRAAAHLSPDKEVVDDELQQLSETNAPLFRRILDRLNLE